MKNQSGTNIRIVVYFVSLLIMIYIDINKAVIAITAMLMSINILYRIMIENPTKKEEDK